MPVEFWLLVGSIFAGWWCKEKGYLGRWLYSLLNVFGFGVLMWMIYKLIKMII